MNNVSIFINDPPKFKLGFPLSNGIKILVRGPSVRLHETVKYCNFFLEHPVLSLGNHCVIDIVFYKLVIKNWIFRLFLSLILTSNHMKWSMINNKSHESMMKT